MITRTPKARIARVAGFAVGAALIAGVAVVATASAAGMTFGFRPTSPSPQPSDAQVAGVNTAATSTVCSDFMKNFANDLHKSQAEINAAFQKAIADTLAGEVKSGKLTQAQADAIQKKLAGQTPCALPSTPGRPRAGAPDIKSFMQQYEAAAAAALGVTEAQLKTDLGAGQSLSQIAAAQHVSEADFRARLIAGLTPALDAAVSSKTLTAPQEQMILARLRSGELPLWNLPVRRPKPSPAVPPATAA